MHAQVEHVLDIEPFARIDQQEFARTPPGLRLRDILANDCRIRRFNRAEIVVGEGDYETSAFFILNGTVCVMRHDAVTPGQLGRRQRKRTSIFGAAAQLWRNHTTPEWRDWGRYAPDGPGGGAEPFERKRLDLTEEQLGQLTVVEIGWSAQRASHITGNFRETPPVETCFGEIGALSRIPRLATVVAKSDETELLEIRWQGLRDIMEQNASIKTRILDTYKQNLRNVWVRRHALTKQLSDEEFADLIAESQFQMHGEFEWGVPFRELAEKGTSSRFAGEPILAAQGHFPNGIILILAGFARLSVRYGGGERTISYLGPGGVFGFDELYHNRDKKLDPIPYQYTLRAVGYVASLFIPERIFQDYDFAQLPKQLQPKPIRGRQTATTALPDASGLDVDMLEFLVQSRTINGTQTMVINLDRCTRCDDCVEACAATHDNNPRFVRHGPKHDHYMIANACMHCADPVCMIGCPTGAIHRLAESGQVTINDDTCIGCQTCANNCPYDNIRMVELRDGRGSIVRDVNTRLPILRATKCDLCADQLGGPACQRACPHDALIRIDLTDAKKTTLRDWLCR